MRMLLLIVLFALPVHADVRELFARTHAAVEKANGIEFDFELRGAKTLRGHGAVLPNGAMLIETPEFTVWSDGSAVEVREPAAKTVWTTAMHRAGSLLLGKYLSGVPDAFASPTRFEDALVYKPKLAGTATIRGEACDLVSIDYPGGGWRWYFDRDDHLLRRQERISKDATETIDYWNVRRLSKTIARPSSKGFAVKPYRAGGPEPGDAPQWSVTTFDGKTISSDALRGRVTILDFWASWCGPCRPSMKALQALHEQQHRDLAILGLRWMDQGDPAAFAKTLGITYPLADVGAAANTFALERYGLPLLFVIGRDGRVVDYATGYKGAATEKWLAETIAKARRR